MPHRLAFETGGSARTVPLEEGESLLGSGDGCDVRLTDPTISRRHAVIRVRRDDGERVEVEDLGSTNGTRVRGRRIDGPVPVAVGDPLAFGSVEGRLERVAEEDLQAAVTFDGGTGPASEAGDASGERAQDRASDRATASIGSLQRFPLDHLPGWLRSLEDRAPLVDAAQTVGASLFDVLPCRVVRVTGGRSEGVLFEAKLEEPDRAERERRGASRTVAISGPAATVTVEFVHGSQAVAYRLLVEAAVRLLSLATRRAPPRRPAEHPEPPEPPRPPTVVPRVRRVYEDAARVARGEVSVLITGESGTGKEVLARYVHRASPRKNEPFVAINCAALPRDLLESELFGIEQGVATGVRPRPGKFELADGGTLFLDEIADMAPETQAKILRVLQEGEVYRVGGREPRSARVRVLAATNQDVDRAMDEGRFRRDLYHRIADWRVELPPLRERRGDIPNLAAFFLERKARAAEVRVAGISRAAMERLRSFSWPGNVRQLEREMARAALFVGDGELLQSSHLSDAVGPGDGRPHLGAGGSLKERLERWERLEIERAIGEHEGNLSAVARTLGIGRSTLYRRIKELGIETG